MTEILDTIDNALHDYDVSVDAMRRTPEPQPSTPDLEAIAATRKRRNRR